MGDNVVRLPTRNQDRLIWVCDCNCTTFRLFADGHAECASCEVAVRGGPQGWRERMPTPPQVAEKVEPDAVAVLDLDGADVFLKRRAREAEAIAAVIVLSADAQISTWQRGDAEPEWIKAQLDHAKTRLIDRR